MTISRTAIYLLIGVIILINLRHFFLIDKGIILNRLKKMETRGKFILEYKIVKEIAHTNHAILYQVKFKNALVALKIARTAKPLDNEIITREYQILNNIKHPNIVEVFDCAQFKERTFFTLEYIDGLPINIVFQDFSDELINCLIQIINALGVLHKKNFIHCDLNPANILYDISKKRAVLIDFGFAAQIGSSTEKAGTIGYIAPEVFKGIATDQRSDIYSLGIILLKLMGDKKIPKELFALGKRMIAKEPALRPSLPEVHRICTRFSSHKDISAFDYTINIPTTVYIELPEIGENIKNHKQGLLVIKGENGIGKTRIIRELKFKFITKKYAVFHYSANEHHSLLASLIKFTDLRTINGRDTNKFQIFESISNSLCTIARQKKLVMLLDELENFTQYEIELLRYLLYGLQNSKTIIIAAQASTIDIPDLKAMCIDIRCFNVAETNTLVAETFMPIQILSNQNAIELTKFTKWLHQQTNGNPLFIVEVMHCLKEQNILIYKNYKWCINMQNINNIKIPGKLENLISNKISTLSTKHLSILKLAALSEMPLPVSFIAMNFNDQIETDIANLNASGYLSGIIQGSEYCVFVPNQILRSGLLKIISDQEKREIGESLVRTIKSTKSCDEPYYTQILAQFAEPTGTEEAAKYLLISADNAEKVFDYTRAIEYLSRAQKIYKKKNYSKHDETALRIAELHYKTGSNDIAMHLFKEILATDNKETQAKVNAGIGRIHSMLGHYEQAIEYLEKASKVKSGNNHNNYLMISNQLAYALISSHQFNRAEKVLAANLRIANKIKNHELVSDILCYQAVNEWHKSKIADAIKTAQKALDFSRMHKMDLQVAYANGLLSSLFQRHGSYEKAETHIDQSITTYSKMHLINNLCHSLIQKAHIHLLLGKIESAIELYEDIIHRARQINNHHLLTTTIASLGAAYFNMGNFNVALEHYQEALDQGMDIINTTADIAQVKLIQGKIRESLDMVADLLRKKHLTINAYAIAAIVYQANQDTKKAKSMIAKAIHLLQTQNFDSNVLIEAFKIITQFYLESNDHLNALAYSQKVIKCVSKNTIMHDWAQAIVGICKLALIMEKDIPINQMLKKLRAKEFIYEYALIRKYYIKALLLVGRMNQIKAETKSFNEITEIFTRLGAGLELQRLKKLQSLFSPPGASDALKSGSIDYLNIFSRLASTIHKNLGNEKFIEQVLDLIIEATGAERGALFLATPQGMQLSYGRNIDKVTLKDAAALSNTAIKEASHKGIIYTYNASADPEYNTRRSVILNKIRAIICIPLAVDNEIIGTIYVDSRIKAEIFNRQNETFLLAVCQILASIIQKSLAFARVAEEKEQLEELLIKNIGTGYMLGKSNAMKRLYRLVKKIAATNSPVLILGETGTGKGMLARYIHMQSKRKEHNFQIINCGTIPETLLESELFGHKKGAFTSAVNDKSGLLEEAQGGTIFLDEITNTSPAFQAKILEAIEDKTIRRVGDTKNINIDVRFLFATNQNLEIEVEENRFRKDLFYRINTFTVEIPALRDRTEDIALLARFFLEKTSRDINKKIKGFTADTEKKLENYHWPGNIRELQNVIERAVVLSQSKLITARELFLGNDQNEILPLVEIKKEGLIEALNATGFNISRTAQILGVNRKTIQRYLKKYQISKK